MKQEIFRMERVTYLEQEILLLDDLNLEVFQGEVLGMLTIHAHGMNAFLRLLQNNLPLHDGYVYCGGRLVNSWRSSDRSDNRVSIIGTEKRLVDSLHVYDNVFVLRQGYHQEIISNRLLKKQLEPFLSDIGMEIRPDARVEELTVFERITVELVRAVVMGNRLIVLHEVGNLINEEEKQRLLEMIRHYTEKGFSFLYICSNYEELREFCDRIACFSNGRVQKVIRREEMNDTAVSRYLEEYEDLFRNRAKRRPAAEKTRQEILRMRRIDGEYLHDFSLTVYRNECLAVRFGSSDMLKEFWQLFQENDREGFVRLWLWGEEEDPVRSRKLALIQEQPTKSMLFPQLSYLDNLCFSLGERLPAVWSFRKLRESIRQEYKEQLGPEVFTMQVDELSKRQKLQLVYTRILLQKPQVVFCVQPFKGADRTHRLYVWEMLEMLLENGITVVILVLNLSDVWSMADRLVMIGADGEMKEIDKLSTPS